MKPGNFREKLGREAPLVMGILNCTPDSFFDGGRYDNAGKAVARAAGMVSQGAGIIDVGGESTRPGSAPVGQEEEIRRVVPVIKELSEKLGDVRSGRVPVSVDTRKSGVAEKALEAGASIINDISGFRFDGRMKELAASAGVPVVVMHMKGTPGNMQDSPEYSDVVGEISDFFRERISALESAGIRREDIILDPGIGFGKTTAHNLEILAAIGKLRELGPVLIGASRKSFIGRILGGEREPVPAEERMAGSIAAAVWSAVHGADIVRVHDVRETVDALRVIKSIKREG